MKKYTPIYFTHLYFTYMTDTLIRYNKYGVPVYLAPLGYKFYFSQSEMFISNVHLGYVLTRGGGQAVQGGLSCSPPRISERIDNPQILLYHLLQEYLVERNINFISVNQMLNFCCGSYLFVIIFIVLRVA